MKSTLILATLISLATLTSCYTNVNESDAIIQQPHTTLTRLEVAFTTTETAWAAPTRALSATSSEASRIALAIFDEQGKAVNLGTEDSPHTTLTQNKDDNGFGTFADLRLQPGTYTFTIVAHKAAAASEPAATITSTTSATLPGDNILDTYSASQSVTILTGQTQSVSINVPLSVSKLALTTLDDIPSGTQSIRITTSPGAPALTTFTFNPTSGLLPQAASITRTWNVSSYVGGPCTLNFYLLSDQFPLTTDIKVDLLGADNNLIHTRTYSNITFNRGKVRTIQTYLFSGTNSTSLTFDEWTTEEPLFIE